MDEKQREAIAGFARAALDGRTGKVLVDVGQKTYEVVIDAQDQATVEVRGAA